MSCVKVKFQSYLLLLLFSYDRNWPVYFMLIALGLICDTKEVWLRHARYFKSPSLAVASLPDNVYARRCIALKSGCPTFHSHSLSPMH